MKKRHRLEYRKKRKLFERKKKKKIYFVYIDTSFWYQKCKFFTPSNFSVLGSHLADTALHSDMDYSELAPTTRLRVGLTGLPLTSDFKHMSPLVICGFHQQAINWTFPSPPSWIQWLSIKWLTELREMLYLLLLVAYTWFYKGYKSVVSWGDT